MICMQLLCALIVHGSCVQTIMINKHAENGYSGVPPTNCVQLLCALIVHSNYVQKNMWGNMWSKHVGTFQPWLLLLFLHLRICRVEHLKHGLERLRPIVR